jgi:hypothetical protein
LAKIALSVRDSYGLHDYELCAGNAGAQARGAGTVCE